MFWALPLLFFVACAVVLYVLSGMEFAKMRAYADGLSGDGTAESYSQNLHSQMVRRARYMAYAAGALALLWTWLRKPFLAFATNLREERKHLRTDLTKGRKKLVKFTSKTHKWWVLGIMAGGVLLRAVFLFEPITYDEAFTYVHYISKPLSVLLSDYSYPNNHIFHNLLAKPITIVFGGGPVPLRITAFLFGVLTMPLAYLVVRAMFNRYIALTTLALVASGGGFVEYSALARGYSITWVCFLVALLLGRYFFKKNNLYAMLLMALVLAIGIWAVPVMVYPALLVYCWLFIRVVLKYNRSLNERFYKLLISVLLMLVLSALFYIPVLVTYGPSQLFANPNLEEQSWSKFVQEDHKEVFAIWVYITHFSKTWIIWLLMAGMLFSSIVSSKYRVLAVASLVAVLPMVLLQSAIGPPRIWNFLFFLVYLGGGIGIYYFLKFLQSKVLKSLHKRVRTIASAVLIFLGCGYLTYLGVPDRIFRMPEVEQLGQYFSFVLKKGDRVVVDFPIEAPVEYHFLLNGLNTAQLYNEASPEGTVYVLVNNEKLQDLEEVLDARSDPQLYHTAELIEEKGHTAIYRTKLK